MFDDDESRDVYRLCVIVVTLILVCLSFPIQCTMREKVTNTDEATIKQITEYANTLATRRLQAYDQLDNLKKVTDSLKPGWTNNPSETIDRWFLERNELIDDAEREAVAAFAKPGPWTFRPMLIIGGIGLFVFLIPGICVVFRERAERAKQQFALNLRIQEKKAEADILNSRILANPNYNPLEEIVKKGTRTK